MAPIATFISAIASILLLLNILAGVLGLIALILVGPWDLLVWLTNADWKTSNFNIPILGASLIAGAISLNKIVLSPILDWAEKRMTDRQNQ